MNGVPDDIRALLDEAAAYGIARARELTPETDEDALGFVLSAIQTCVLPRVLDITVDGRPALCLKAAGGRLHELVEIGVDPAAGPFRDMAGRALDPADPEGTRRIADLLRSLFSAGRRIALASRAADAMDDRSRHAVPASDLLDALDLVPLAPDAAARLDLLLASAEDVAIALHRKVETLLIRDDAALPDPLVDCLNRALDPDRGLVGLACRHEILFFVPVSDLPFGAGLFHGADGPAALVFERDALEDLARFWTELPAMYGRIDA